jgi:hypothetical protein
LDADYEESDSDRDEYVLPPDKSTMPGINFQNFIPPITVH